MSDTLAPASADDRLASVMDIPEFAPQVTAMIGIGVGIDYALFVVTRYRQALHAGHDPETAVVTAIAVEPARSLTVARNASTGSASPVRRREKRRRPATEQLKRGVRPRA